jgi:RsmE family RNA methyltransferase
MTLGLEQAVDIRMPTLHSHLRFRPFVEDVLPGLQTDRPSYVADPSGTRPCPRLEQGAVCNLLIGPEGGWVPFELDILGRTGVDFVRLGQRILRVETALPYMVGCLQIGNN